MSTQRLTAVDKALLLLKAFELGDRSLTLAELADRTKLNKSTILRFASSFERANLLVKLPVGGFRLGGQVLALAAIFRECIHFDREVRPLLVELATETLESASFFLLEGENWFRVARIEANQAVRDAPSPLLLQPLRGDVTSVGLVLRMKPGKYVGDVKGAFAPIFTTGIKQVETASMASPVLGSGGTLIGAVSLAGPAFRLTIDAAEKLAPAVARKALTLSRIFGYDQPVPVASRPVVSKKIKPAVGSRGYKARPGRSSAP